MRDFSLPLTVRSAHYVAGHGRVIPQKVTYHVTKNPNNTGEIGAGVYIGKQTLKNRRSFKKSYSGGGFFLFGFFAVFRGSCLATSHEKPECTKDSGFFYASVNGTCEMYLMLPKLVIFTPMPPSTQNMLGYNTECKGPVTL